MKIRNSNCSEFWSASANIFLLVLAAMNLPQNVSAARYFGNETDRIALFEFKKQISDGPNGILSSWNDSTHHCQWQGITCGTRHQRVTSINLPGTNLLGTISPHIGNLSFLKFVQLEENQLHGEIPQDLGRLFRLRFLNLSSNTLTGEIPVNLSQCSELRILHLIRNKLIGKIPSQFGSLKKLERLALSANNLTGEIPSTIGNLSSIKELSVTFNNLEGNLPEEMSLLTSLIFLAMGSNKLTGEFPPSMYNISTLTFFTAPDNFLYGSLPSNLALKLPNLQIIGIAGNGFSGRIPLSITNCTNLVVIDLGDNNKIEGQVPYNLGRLLNLQILSLQGNLLGGNSTSDLDFLVPLTNCSNLRILSLSGNKFGGVLPNILGNLSDQLTHLYLSKNQISGTIPMGLQNLVNLYILSLADNLFTGVIPSDFGKLQLQVLVLQGNKLSGQVPSTLCNITNLYVLNISNNNFQGDIGHSLQNCRHLQMLFFSQNNFSGTLSSQMFGSYISPKFLDLSYNSLSGPLPLEVGKLRNIQLLDVSNNMFSGEIPSTLGDCSSLEYIYMHSNLFNGTIPKTLASLKGIRYLNLSRNNFTGQIPRDINRLDFLIYLDLSYNDLEGEVPTDGVFGNASQIRLVGNSKLCGGIPELQLPSCVVKEKKKRKHIIVIVIPLVILVILISIVFLFYHFAYRKRENTRKEAVPSEMVERMLRISYHDLYRATDGFSSSNLVGCGSFGFVYKGRLDQHGHRLVAIKVLDLQKSGASKSFEAECRALRNIRHRNLVPLLTYCSSIDPKGHDFKALIYEFMQNGNLDTLLHPEPAEASISRNLNFLQRLNISIDVASALDYLHNCYEVAIVHCDLKPSNILLDDDLIAHVGDFGLAKLLPRTASNTSQQASTSSANALKGTIGYAAPEYGMGLEVSTEGDIYSFGILLLEMFTGRRPTDDGFIDGLDLHNYVKADLLERVGKIIDPSLLSNLLEENEEVQAAFGDEVTKNGKRGIVEKNNAHNAQKCLIAIFEVGVGCSQKFPKDRIDLKEVTRKLHSIRDAFLDGRNRSAEEI